CARKRRSRTGKFSKSPSSFIPARRRSRTRCRLRSDAGSCARLGRAAWSTAPRTREGSSRRHRSARSSCFTRWRSSSRSAAARFATEQAALANWLNLVAATARADYPLALQIARMRSLVKGYGETHERGQAKFDKLVVVVPRLLGRSNSGATLEGLIKAALADED